MEKTGGMMLMQKITVLMAAYNADKYIEEQLESLLGQVGVDLRIEVCNDGSTDNTLHILNRYISANPEKISCVSTINKGVRETFLNLLFSCNLESDYFAFSDSDDVWESDKLLSAVKVLADYENVPVMYCSQLKLVDANLNYLGLTAYPKSGVSFENALVEDVVSGGTVVFNKKAMQILRKNQPKYIVMHDAWVYLVMAALGKIIFSKDAKILYRQHGNNFYGGVFSLRKRWLRRFRSLFCVDTQNSFYEQAVSFKEIYGCDLDKEKSDILELSMKQRGSLLERLNFIFRSPLKKQRFLSQVLFIVLVIFKKI